MNTASIRSGDMVLVNKKGRRFHAQVLGREKAELKLLPITPGITWMTCTTREVEDYWISYRRFQQKGSR